MFTPSRGWHARHRANSAHFLTLVFWQKSLTCSFSTFMWQSHTENCRQRLANRIEGLIFFSFPVSLLSAAVNHSPSIPLFFFTSTRPASLGVACKTRIISIVTLYSKGSPTSIRRCPLSRCVRQCTGLFLCFYISSFSRHFSEATLSLLFILSII